LLRPLFSTLVMAVLVAIAGQIPTGSLVLLLAVKVSVGAITYITAMYLLWQRSGYPDGLETLIVERLHLLRKAD